MNSERTEAYGRVLLRLADVGASMLHAPERARIREAADTLIFASSLDEARAVLEDLDALCELLVSTGRWSEQRAADMAQDLLACGPLAPVR